MEITFKFQYYKSYKKYIFQSLFFSVNNAGRRKTNLFEWKL
jgi:hypothetical protein